ncbi:ATP-binding protein [Streptomyces sviceus]|uniref:hypothetical protein n=1 Tax=Streptomyces sviceus TaxID=285530 RepID=UPI0036A6F1A1
MVSEDRARAHRRGTAGRTSARQRRGSRGTATYADDLLITIPHSGSRASTRPAFPRSGYGLIGMRERAHAAAGRLRAGHRPRGGFEVVAELPLRLLPIEELSAKEDTAP